MNRKYVGFLIVISLLVITSIALYSFKKKNTSLNIVRTQSGLVQGISTNTPGVMAFEGIPYAAAPIGDLRWKDPQAPPHWKGIRKADHFCANCMQATEAQQANPPHALRPSVWTKPFLIPPDEPLSENCLFLNIWTAAHSAKDHLPVIVWIHGGGFTGGSGSVPIYNGEALAAKGVVFVTINYRLGVFGFLATPELSKESPHHSSGNYGLLDQVAALKWVHDNIAAFGGDPDNVTIDGQSAGSFSVNYLQASPLAHGLFKRVIGESGANMVPDPMTHANSLPAAEAQGEKWMQRMHIPDMAALRKLPADSLLALRGPSSPIIDGYFLPETVRNIFLSGRQNDVPTISGWNADEGRAFAAFMPSPTAASFKKTAEKNYGDQATDFLHYYPANNNAEAANSQYDLTRDLLFGIQNYSWAKLQSKTGKARVYVYYFTRKLPASTPEYAFYGAFHTGEVVYDLDNLKYVNRPWQPSDKQLARLMSNYWVQFAKTGNPNNSGLPNWPTFTDQDQQAMIFGKESHAGKVPNQEAMNFLINFFEK